MTYKKSIAFFARGLILGIGFLYSMTGFRLTRKHFFIKNLLRTRSPLTGLVGEEKLRGLFFAHGSLLFVLCSLLIAPCYAVTGWTTDHANCDDSYLSINCSEGYKICGYDGTLYCALPSAVNAALPATTGTADNKLSSGTGGYQVNCTQDTYDCTTPASLWVCKASTTCAAKNVKTTCTASAHTSSCGTCLTGYLDCNGVGTGVDADGCEIQVGGACTSGGLTGTYGSSCVGSNPPTCNTTSGNFQTGILAEISSTDPLLWGKQYGSGYLMNLSKNGGNSVVIDNSGNMGIGTTSPTNPLDITHNNGSYGLGLKIKNTATSSAYTGITFQDNDSENLNIFTSTSGQNYIRGISNAPLVFYTNNAERMQISATGNVGIGTTSPINRSGHSTGWLNISGSSSGIALTEQGEADKTQFIEANTQKLLFGTMSDAGASAVEHMAIQSDGKVGIGTTSPLAGLHVINATVPQLRIGSSESATLTKHAMISGTHYTAAEEPVAMLYSYSDATTNQILIGGGSSSTNAATQISFYTGANSTTPIGTSRVRIDSSGNVGIGTTSPLTKLHIVDDVASTPTIYLSGGSHDIGWDSTQNLQFSTFDGTTASTKLTILPSGYVGIGTATPSTALQVAGTVTATAFVGSGAGLTNLPGGSVSGLSDTTITAAASGDFLRHNGTAWVDATLSVSDIPNLSATYQPLDADLTDLADGTLTATKVQYGDMFITTAGTSGQVWKSDGVGAGAWGADTDTDSNAGTLCADGTFLNGDGTCDIGYLDSDGIDSVNDTVSEDELDDAFNGLGSGLVRFNDTTDAVTIDTAAYITDGNTGWDNSYGFITSAGSSANFTGTLAGDVTGTQSATVVGDDSHAHTSGTISGLSVVDFSSPNITQWTNNAGYITSADDSVSESELDDAFNGLGTGFVHFNDATDAVTIDTNTYATTSSLGSYLPLVGGTLTGDLIMGNGADIKMTYSTFPFDALRSTGGDAYGISLEMGSGARTVIGSGESAGATGTNTTATDETLFLSSDQGITFSSNIQPGWASRKTMTFDISGNLAVPGNVTGGNVTSGADPGHTHTAYQASDADLTDLAVDGSLTATKVQYGDMFITTAGTSGQVWKSDGTGAGVWGTDNDTTYSAAQLNQDDLTNNSIGDIGGVTITAAASGDFLRHNGTAWVDATIGTGDIPDISATYQTVAGTSAWDKNASDDFNGASLGNITDVTITTNTAGEILKWNGTAWINNTLAEAGIQPAGSYLTSYTETDPQVGTLTNTKWCTSDGSQVICNTTAPVSSQWTTSGSNISYTTGSVGIGTASPSWNGGANSNLLHIHSSVAGQWAGVHFTNAETGAAAADGVVFEQIGADAGIYNYENGNLTFNTNGSTGQMILNSSGNVGIGTASPGSALQVTKVGATEQIRIVDDGSQYGRIGYEQGNNTIFGLYNTYTNAGARIDLGFGTSAIASTTPKLTVLGSGYVGIGTATPSTLLTLANDGWISGVNSAGTGVVNMFKVNANDEIEVGGSLNIGTLGLAEDSGAVTLVNLPVSATPTAGTEQSYSFSIDASPVLKVYSEANGSGGTQNEKIAVTGNITASGTVTATAFVGSGAGLTGVSTADVKVSIDSGATADYIGATGSDGVLRTSSPISYTDGGNYVTLGITSDAITDTHLAYNTGQHLTTTSSPSFALLQTVDGTNGTVTINHDATGMYLEQDGSSTANEDIRFQSSKSGDNANYAQFYIDPTDGFAFMSTGTGNGNVGIGTATPAQKLHVKGLIHVEDDDSTDTVTVIGNSGDDGWINLYQNTVSKALIHANGDSYFNGGNVGIGTASPTQKLDVVGTVKATAFVGDGSGLTGLVSSLAGLSDTTITPPVASGEILKWNGTAWINNTLTEAGITDDQTCAEVSGCVVGAITSSGTATNFSGSLAGDVTGTQGATVVGDDSHAHTAGTISGLAVADFASPNISQWTNNSGYITDGNTRWDNSYGFITSSGSTSGYAGSLYRIDDRTIAPADISSGRLKFAFTSWANNDTSPYADALHMRSYNDFSGGSDNLVMFNKNGIGMRIWQQTWGSATPYATYKDVILSGDNISLLTNNAGYITSSGTATNFSGSLAGDVTGTQGATVVGDDSHAHTAGTISGLAVADFASPNISQWTNNSGYVTTSDDTVSGTELDGVFSANGLLKRTGAGTYTVDTNTYITAAGNVATATALAANGANCPAGQYPLGVNASGAVESCTADNAGTDDQTCAEVSGCVQNAITGASPTITTPTITTGSSASAMTIGSGKIYWNTATSELVIEVTGP